MITEEKNITKISSTDTAGPVIEIKGLYKSFGKDNAILKGVDLTVNRVGLRTRVVVKFILPLLRGNACHAKN